MPSLSPSKAICGISLLLSLCPAAAAGELRPHTLTAAEAAAANAQRVADWYPHKIQAGDVFVADDAGNIYIPTVAWCGVAYCAFEAIVPPVTREPKQ